VVFLVREYAVLRRERVISAREFWISTILHQHGPVTASDTSFIRSWMTFDYVNDLFHLPSDYLKTQLSVTDPGYPKISIGGYAVRNRIEATTFISELDAAVANYLNATST
jgi:hypothetical protein